MTNPIPLSATSTLDKSSVGLGSACHLDELYQQRLFVVLKARNDLADQTQRAPQSSPATPKATACPICPESWPGTLPQRLFEYQGFLTA
jgi:hypothetical protein